LLRAEMMNEVKGVLTDEQVAALEAKRSEMHERMKHRFEDRVDDPGK
jgi:hypothetical protein